MSRRKPVIKNRVDAAIEKAIVELALAEPTWRQTRVANELAKQGMKVLPTGARCVWQRHGLERKEKRLRALEAKVAQEGSS
jgi:ParB-like chromosome segregation protein Spo0J